MREIKFRAWDQVNHKMHYDDSGQSISMWITCEGFIPMQFTGLRDKNGKEIYEGDIVSLFGLYLGERDVVTWNDVFALYELPGHWNTAMTHKVDCDTSLEVIGNIHENPDLIKHDN